MIPLRTINQIKKLIRRDKGLQAFVNRLVDAIMEDDSKRQIPIITTVQ